MGEQEEEFGQLSEKRIALRTAIEELAHLRPNDYLPPSPATEEPLISKLKKEDIKKLSNSTKAVLKELSIDLTKETIPEVLGILEVEFGTAEEAKASELQLVVEEFLELSFSAFSATG